MSQNRSGIALVICAPSGTGKTTLIKRLVAESSRFAYSISYTTRPPRPGEIDGKDYHFLTREQFIQKRDTGYFAEWANVHSNFYGTPLVATQQLLASGKDMVFDIDVQGASQLRRTVPGARLIFILPPSHEELEKRLRGRQTETEESIQKRLSNAHDELAQAHWFNTWIVNENLETAWQQLRAAYIAATLSPTCHPDFLNNLLHEWK